MAHAWKACWVKTLGGSNPPSSANINRKIQKNYMWHVFRQDVGILAGTRTSGHPEIVAPSRARLIWRFLQSRAKKLVRRVGGKILEARWAVSSNSEPTSLPQLKASAFDLVSTKVINLDHRTDRLAAVSKEMKRLGDQGWVRIPAVDGKKKYTDLDPLFAGSIACTESHIDALASMDWSSAAAAMICEDDLEFLANRSEIEGIIEEFLANPLLSVLCLSGRPRGGSFPISRRLRIATGIVGRGCYLVKPAAAQALIAAFQAGIPHLVLGRVAGKGDRMWGRLQRRGYFFAIPRTPIAQQGAGYSDIEDTMLGPR